MARYQLRRPSPIQIFPRRVRRQDPAATTTAAAPAPTAEEEEEEEEDEGPESPESPFSSPSTVGGEESPSPEETTFPAAEGAEPGEESDDEEEEEEPEGVSSEAPSQTTGAPPGQITEAPSATGSSAIGPPATDTPGPTITTTVVGDISSFSSQNNQPVRPTSTSTGGSAAQSEISGGGSDVGANPPPQKSQSQKNGPAMSTGAEAALITFTVLGGIALIVGAVIFMRRRRRRKSEMGMRHAEDAFDPGNTGSLRAPETIHVGITRDAFGGGSHLTQSSTTNSLFAAGEYERPETVSTDRNRSRFAGPQPTPNPFADPPLNKAYDVLRGRPRSTTLTDRGSWVKNPFKDPESDRFDPFGELQEKARTERVRYMEQLQKEREQQFLEKERMGLGVPDAARKGSGVTVEGLGVLDRSGSGQYR